MKLNELPPGETRFTVCFCLGASRKMELPIELVVQIAYVDWYVWWQLRKTSWEIRSALPVRPEPTQRMKACDGNEWGFMSGRGLRFEDDTAIKFSLRKVPVDREPFTNATWRRSCCLDLFTAREISYARDKIGVMYVLVGRMGVIRLSFTVNFSRRNDGSLKIFAGVGLSWQPRGSGCANCLNRAVPIPHYDATRSGVWAAYTDDDGYHFRDRVSLGLWHPEVRADVIDFNRFCLQSFREP